MPLTSGTRLGSYEIVAPIGAGGMGEVYRARDSKLNRDVATKVLPEQLASDPASLARFEREAQAVAALSHPNILAIHDFGGAPRPFPGIEPEDLVERWAANAGAPDCKRSGLRHGTLVHHHTRRNGIRHHVLGFPIGSVPGHRFEVTRRTGCLLRFGIPSRTNDSSSPESRSVRGGIRFRLAPGGIRFRSSDTFDARMRGGHGMQRRSRHAVLFPLLTLVLAAPAVGSVETKPWPMDFGVRVDRFAFLQAAPPRFTPGDVDAPPIAAAPRKPLHPAVLVLIGEAAIIVNSYLATPSPDAYGGLAIVLAPFTGAFCEQCNKAEAVVGGISLAGIGAYNLFFVDKDELRSTEIFTRNFVAWHVAVAALAITYAASRPRSVHATGSENDATRMRGSVSVFPVRKGAGLSYSYRY